MGHPGVGSRGMGHPGVGGSLENSLNLRFGFPRVKRHFSYECNEQCLGSRLPGLMRRADHKVGPSMKRNLRARSCITEKVESM
jgi:hypothetical protein